LSGDGDSECCSKAEVPYGKSEVDASAVSACRVGVYQPEGSGSTQAGTGSGNGHRDLHCQ